MKPRVLKVPTCHPEAPYQGKGLCKACYCREYARRPENKSTLKARRDRYRNTPEAKEKKYLAMIKRKYGCTKELYQKMFQQHEGSCHVCFQKPSEGKRLHLDHCHDTGKIRGLLCAQCNWFAGKIDKIPKLLMRLFIYERKWTEI